MSRAFYPASRAHHAFNMAIDFGMRFKMRNGFWSNEGLLGITGAAGYQIEVADESLPLLKPQNGDKDLDGYVYSDALKWWLLSATDQKGYMHVFNKGFRSETAIRNGMPFHWPEFEP